MKAGVYAFTILVLFSTQLLHASLLNVTPAQQNVDIIINTRHTFVFDVRNLGKAPVNIKRVVPSCGCTSASIEKSVLQSGATTQLSVCVTAGATAKPYSVSVAIELDSPMTENEVVSVSGNVINVVDISPKKLDFVFIEGEPKPLPVKVSANASDKVTATIVGFRSALANRLSAEIGGLSGKLVAEQGNKSSLIVAYAGAAGEADLDGAVILDVKVNKGLYSIELPVEVRHLPLISLSPPIVEAKVSGDTTAVERRILLRPNSKTASVEYAGYSTSASTARIDITESPAMNGDMYLFVSVQKPLSVVGKEMTIFIKMKVNGAIVAVKLPLRISLAEGS